MSINVYIESYVPNIRVKGVIDVSLYTVVSSKCSLAEPSISPSRELLGAKGLGVALESKTRRLLLAKATNRAPKTLELDGGIPLPSKDQSSSNFISRLSYSFNLIFMKFYFCMNDPLCSNNSADNRIFSNEGT